LIPVEINPPPMSMTADPVTTGGKIFLSSLGGTMAMPTSRSAATMQVPRKRPYPFFP